MRTCLWVGITVTREVDWGGQAQTARAGGVQEQNDFGVERDQELQG